MKTRKRAAVTSGVGQRNFAMHSAPAILKQTKSARVIFADWLRDFLMTSRTARSRF